MQQSKTIFEVRKLAIMLCVSSTLLWALYIKGMLYAKNTSNVNFFNTWKNIEASFVF